MTRLVRDIRDDAIEECAKAALEAAKGFNDVSVQLADIDLAIVYIRALKGAPK